MQHVLSAARVDVHRLVERFEVRLEPHELLQLLPVERLAHHLLQRRIVPNRGRVKYHYNIKAAALVCPSTGGRAAGGRRAAAGRVSNFSHLPGGEPELIQRTHIFAVKKT